MTVYDNATNEEERIKSVEAWIYWHDERKLFNSDEFLDLIHFVQMLFTFHLQFFWVICISLLNNCNLSIAILLDFVCHLLGPILEEQLQQFTRFPKNFHFISNMCCLLVAIDWLIGCHKKWLKLRCKKYLSKINNCWEGFI